MRVLLNFPINSDILGEPGLRRQIQEQVPAK
jgi:hypothetical protein